MKRRYSKKIEKKRDFHRLVGFVGGGRKPVRRNPYRQQKKGRKGN